MTQALPTRRPRLGGWSALALAVGLSGLLAAPARAIQDEKPAGEAKGKARPAAPVDPDDEDKKADEAEKNIVATMTVDGPDRWEDPRAAEAMSNTFPELPMVKTSGADLSLINQLAKGQGTLDPSAIDRYVKSRVADLTKKASIQALMEPGMKGGNTKALEDAAHGLIAPMMAIPTPANRRFREAYAAKLVEALQPIWKMHLHSRTMGMIVLSRSDDPQTLPVFAAQLSDPDQLAIVKLLAAVGITNVAEKGNRDVDQNSAIPPAKALAEFLTTEPDTFWPAKFRAVEALGSLRVASAKPLDSNAEIAATVLAVAADPKNAPTVRAWASWALGMFRIPISVRTYNFPIAANVIGTVAADIGAKVAEQPDAAEGKMARLANMLVQLHLGLVGDPSVRGSGLSRSNHPNAAAARGYIGEVEKRVRAVAKAALEMSTSTRSQMKDRRAALLSANDDLRTFVAKPVPTGRSLYAGAPPVPDPGAAPTPDADAAQAARR